TLVLLVVVLVLAAHPKIGGRLSSNEGWRRFTGAVHYGLSRFRGHPIAAVEVLAAGFVYQLAVVVAAFLAVRALGIDVGFTAILTTQGSANVSAEHAFRNAKKVIKVEHWTGTFHEATIQHWFIHQRLFLQFWDVFYGSAHFIITAFCIVYMFRKMPERYPLW